MLLALNSVDMLASSKNIGISIGGVETGKSRCMGHFALIGRHGGIGRYSSLSRKIASYRMNDADLEAARSSGAASTSPAAAVPSRVLGTLGEKSGPRCLGRRSGRGDAADPRTDSVDDRWRVAVHEAGHAVVGVLTAHVLESVTISGRVVMREGAQSLGRTSFAEVSPFASTADHLRADIAMCMGGRVAEEAVLGAFAVGSAGHENSDLTKATQIAVMMEGVLGMGESLASEPRRLVQVSEALALDPDLRRRVERTLEAARQRAMDIVIGNKPLVEAIAKVLIDRKVISGSDVLTAIAGTAPTPD